MSKNTRIRSKCQPLVDDFLARVNQFDFNALRTVGPIYLTSIGLGLAYAWGWRETYGAVVGLALAAFAITCELIKPVSGESIERARGWRRASLFGCVAAAMAFGAASAVVAINAAEAPTRAYERSQAAISEQTSTVANARADMARFDCTVEMPASRCRAFTAANARAAANAQRVLDRAEAELAAMKQAAAPAPEVVVPHIDFWVKLFVGVGIDFVLVAFPWAARANKTVVNPAPAQHADPQEVRPNDGGWATRRARYGASGLKRKAAGGYQVIDGGRS